MTIQRDRIVPIRCGQSVRLRIAPGSLARFANETGIVASYERGDIGAMVDFWDGDKTVRAPVAVNHLECVKVAPQPVEDEPYSITLVLPYPPSTNNLYESFTTQGGVRGRRLSDEGRAFKEAVVDTVLREHNIRLLRGDVALTFRVFRPRRVRDLTNCFKAVEDALSGHAYIDDSQVVEVHGYRRDDKENPRIEVTIATAGKEIK